MTKFFVNIKTAYSAGSYGNTGEYFTLIIVNGEDWDNFCYHGQNGADSRVVRPLMDAGYKPLGGAFANYGRVNERESKRVSKTEWAALETVNEFIAKHN